MNRNFSLAVIVAAAAAAGNAFASDVTADGTAFVGTRSRAEVQAELAQYQQAGVNPWSTAHNQLRGFQSTRTREQAVAEYIASRDVVAALTREDSGSAYLVRRHAGAPLTIAAH